MVLLWNAIHFKSITENYDITKKQSLRRDRWQIFKSENSTTLSCLFDGAFNHFYEGETEQIEWVTFFNSSKWC